MRKSEKPLGHELRQLFPVWLFFFLAFSLLRLTQSVILEEMGINVTTPSLVLVGSLIVAKAFLVLDWFSFVERYRGKPLLFDVLWKTGIYLVGAVVMYVLEQFVESLIKHHDSAVAWGRLSDAVVNPRFCVLFLWLGLLIFAFTAARETIRALGKERFKSLWFGIR
jgi:hypothetical protein